MTSRGEDDDSRARASELLALAQPFDVIIANAGVMACPQGKTLGFQHPTPP
jgi:hypothetical protein